MNAPALSESDRDGSFRSRGGAWVLSQLALMLAAVALGLFYHRQRGWPATAVTGGVLMGLGGLTALMGLKALGNRLTPFPQPRSNSQLEQGGIYGLVRHPLYSSIIVTALGWALFRQSWPALTVAVAFIPFFEAKTRREEAHLRQQFSEYAAYARRVRRFVPWVY